MGLARILSRRRLRGAERPLVRALHVAACSRMRSKAFRAQLATDRGPSPGATRSRLRAGFVAAAAAGGATHAVGWWSRRRLRVLSAIAQQQAWRRARPAGHR